MDGNYKPYSFTESYQRIASIMGQPAGSFQEVKDLPDREQLTYSNGFYGMCSAVFIDIRDSSGLTEKHKRPTLAKIYRAFISEMVAVLNSDMNVREVNIVGDCVWAVYKTPYTVDINNVFSVVAQAHTLLKLLNLHYRKNGIDPISIGIGVDYGRVLMIKAGFSGSKINDVIYMGDVVNQAAHLAHEAGRGWHDPIYVGGTFASNLEDENRSLLKTNWMPGVETVYTGDIVSSVMNKWIGSLES